MALYGLTKTEAHQLLYKNNTGEFDKGSRRDLTAKNLIKKGMLTLDKTGKYIIVTPKGKAWCDRHHLEVI